MTIEYLGDAEVFQVGMNVEKKGQRFYRNFAENTKNKKTKGLALELLEAEKRHYALFLRLKNGLTFRDRSLSAAVDGEMAKYIDTLIKTNIFASLPDSRLLKKMSDKDALKIGMQAEKDSILFYTEAHNMSQNTSGKRALARLVKEEQGHLVMLRKRLKEIGGWR